MLCLLFSSWRATADEVLEGNVGKRHWGSEQGLPQDGVLALAQTRDGYLWLGTESGLARFDGVRFVTFDRRNTPGLASSLVLSLAQDQIGNLWIGTSGGLSVLREGRIESFHTDPPLAGSMIYAMAFTAEGSMFVGTERGLSVVRGGGARFLGSHEGVPEGPVYSLAAMGDQSVWFATYGNGLGHWQHDHATIFKKRDGLSDDHVVFVAPDGHDAVWVACFGGKLLRYSSGHFKEYSEESRERKNRGIWALHRSRDGRLVVGSFGGGLGVIQDRRLHFLNPREGVRAETVWSLLEDREGNLWAGTSEGLYQFRTLPIKTFATSDGLPGNEITSVYEDRSERIWVGTDAGLVSWNAGTGQKASFPIRLKNAVGSQTQDRTGTLWWGTASDGLWKLLPSQRIPSRVATPWPTQPIYALAAIYPSANEEELWVGTFGAGLWRCRLPEVACFSVPEVASTRIISLLVGRSGTVWVGTREGLASFDGSGWMNFPARDALAGLNVTALFEDSSGALWIGTEKGGLARYAGGSFIWSNTSLGLFDDSVYSILDDDAGRLWIGSTRGFFRIEKKDFPGSKDSPLNSTDYGLSDGMYAMQCSSDTPNAALRSRDGKLWFGTIKGLSLVDPRTVKINNAPPQVTIEEVQIDGVEKASAGRDILLVSPGSRHLEFVFTGLSLTVPEKQRFRYRMEGFDIGWIDGQNARTASYTNLLPRDYQFSVQVRNNDGVWSDQSATLKVRIQPYFYQTLWFRILIVLLIVTAAATINEIRMRAVRRTFQLVLAERAEAAHKRSVELTKTNAELRANLLRLSTGDDLQSVMEQLLSSAMEQLKSRSACFFLYNESNHTLERSYVASSVAPESGLLRDNYFDSYGKIMPVETFGLWQLFLKSRTAVLLHVFRTEDVSLLWLGAVAWHKETDQPIVYAAPLYSGNRIQGLASFNFGSEFTAADFTEDTQNLVQSLTSLASMALETHQLSLRAQDAAVAEERVRISGEMHDGVQQIFTAISFQLGGIANLAKSGKNGLELLPQLERTAEISEEGVREIRRSIRSLREIAPLSEKELVEALELLCQSCDSEKTHCRLVVVGLLNLPTSARLNELHRIAQEAVGNAYRHAGASEVQVRLERREDSLYLSVSDNGVGFSAETKHKGLGLNNMRSRVKRLGGTFSIESGPGRTIVTIATPRIELL